MTECCLLFCAQEQYYINVIYLLSQTPETSRMVNQKCPIIDWTLTPHHLYKLTKALLLTFTRKS